MSRYVLVRMMIPIPVEMISWNWRVISFALTYHIKKRLVDADDIETVHMKLHSDVVDCTTFVYEFVDAMLHHFC